MHLPSMRDASGILHASGFATDGGLGPTSGKQSSAGDRRLLWREAGAKPRGGQGLEAGLSHRGWAGRTAALAGTYAVAMAIFFHAQLLSGFDLGFSDRGDGIIEISILEHWRNVLTGHAAWDRPLYFHPAAATLGYNDGYFLYGLVYSFWRLFADPFLADTLNIATFKSLGFFAAYALARRTLGWQRPVALLLALLFTISNNLLVQAGHAQLVSVALLPLVTMLAIEAGRAELAGRPAMARVLGVALAALVAAWLMTAYYMAWFTLFFALLLGLCWLAVQGREAPRAALALLRAHAGTLAITGTAFAVLVVPFLSIYLPKARETGAHGYVLSYTVTLFDPINVGPGNLLWGWIPALAQALLPQRLVAGEHESGFPLILFALTLLALRRALKDRNAPGMRVFALAVLVGWVLTLRFWLVSPWILVHWLVPGASGLRVVLRYQLFLVLPVLLLVFGVYRDRIALWLRSAPLLTAGAALLLVAEQLNARSPSELGRSEQLRALETLPPPPAGCTSFYVVSARASEPFFKTAALDRIYPHNVDAMYLAERWRVPTINGFSTFTPPGWNFADARAPDYDTRVAAYARAHRLHGLCRLDARDSQPWRRTVF